MNKKTAGVLFLGVCATLAILLLTTTMTFLVGGCLFAIALVVFGSLSRGFRKGP